MNMYQALTFYHTFFRWIVLLILVYAIYRSYRGYATGAAFTRTDNAVRHWTATIAHIQLTLGMILYFQSPVIKYFWSNFKEASKNSDALFFSLIHMFLMLTAVVIITIGSAMAKRKPTDREKFRTMLIWFSIALAIILIAIPWPFSPLANRPYFR
jgi:cytochrome bd-type quinol oxidase subunit 2